MLPCPCRALSYCLCLAGIGLHYSHCSDVAASSSRRPLLLRLYSDGPGHSRTGLLRKHLLLLLARTHVTLSMRLAASVGVSRTALPALRLHAFDLPHSLLASPRPCASTMPVSAVGAPSNYESMSKPPNAEMLHTCCRPIDASAGPTSIDPAVHLIDRDNPSRQFWPLCPTDQSTRCSDGRAGAARTRLVRRRAGPGATAAGRRGPSPHADTHRRREKV